MNCVVRPIPDVLAQWSLSRLVILLRKIKQNATIVVECLYVMSADEDDYLSDKFLLDTHSTSKPSTYSSLRKEAQKKAFLKNEQNKLKSRRQRELESRDEGLGKSLFERAKEEVDAGLSSGNKALSIMMKMGFEPGRALGSAGTIGDATVPDEVPPSETHSAPSNTVNEVPPSHDPTEPLPLNEWAGRKGIGLGKRARSPNAAERQTKLAKADEEASHHDFRDRAREEYNERQAEARLLPAQRSCATMDEKVGRTYHALWLNLSNPNTFPPGLIDALSLHGGIIVPTEPHGDSIQSRLRRQMQAESLQPLDADDDTPTAKPAISAVDQFSPQCLEEAAQFLRLQAQDRLVLVLSYLRKTHFYCFWCGVKYENEEEMESQCPGPDEDVHE